MAHYAILDENNVVLKVITGRNEDEIVDGISDWEAHYSQVTGFRALRCSYNNNIRKQYPGHGFTYDEDADQFVSPQPFPNWTLDENNDWQPPVPLPDDADTVPYDWDVDANNWVDIRSLPFTPVDDGGEPA